MFVRIHHLIAAILCLVCFSSSSHTHLSHILLHQLGANDSDEAGVCPVSHSTGAQGLSCARWPEQQHAFWRLDTQIDKPLRLVGRGGGQTGKSVTMETCISLF